MKTFTEWEATTDGYSNSEKNLMELAWNASAENSAEEIAKLQDLLEEQKGTIKALNWALGGEDSTSTENLIDAHEVDYADEGLIALCRKLTQENVRLEDVVLCQKKAWTADFEELELLKDQLASSESSPVLNRVKAEVNVAPPTPAAPGKEDASFEHWYETRFKPAMERGTFDRYVARQAWFASKADAIEKGEV